MKKIFIAGGSGMLGTAFYEVFKNDYNLKITDKDLNDKWVDYLDFNNENEYKKMVNEFDPDFLFHIGALTDLEYCEKNIDLTYISNTISVETAVNISNSLNIPLLYISTAGIFDGKKQTYDDWDTPNPINHYGRSKYNAEKFVIENSENYIICRAGWMMGGGKRKDKKFVSKIINQINKGNKEIFVVNDKLGTPTYTIDFAKNVKLLIENNERGLFNLICDEKTSRLEVANFIISKLNLKNKIKITEVDSNFFESEYFAKRPHSEILIPKRLKLKNLYTMRSWKESLTEYIDLYFNEDIE
tara:strand:+ start:248 stop:1147 length:900 start_codon:yes stop_codon:yes gene_type:complete